MSDKIKEIFEIVLEIKIENESTISVDQTEEWDSIKHLQLMSTIEDEFGIKLNDEDLLSLTSFESVKNRLQGL